MKPEFSREFFIIRKTVVAGSIAEAQAGCGMVGAGSSTFDRAFAYASQTPQRPKPVKGVYSNLFFEHNYQGDAYRAVFNAAVHAHDLAAARRTAAAWLLSNGDAEAQSIVVAWTDAGLFEEAASFARRLNGPASRVSALILLAEKLLDRAGAPNI